MGFILLTHQNLKQFAMKELRAYTDSLVRVRVNARLKLPCKFNKIGINETQ